MIGIEIEVIEETLRTETHHMTEVEGGVGIIEGRFSKNRRDSGSRNRGRSTSWDKLEEKKFHYCREPGHF